MTILNIVNHGQLIGKILSVKGSKDVVIDDDKDTPETITDTSKSNIKNKKANNFNVTRFTLRVGGKNGTQDIPLAAYNLDKIKRDLIVENQNVICSYYVKIINRGKRTFVNLIVNDVLPMPSK